MKFFVALALAAIAVSAADYDSGVSSSSSSFYYKQPELPCAFSLSITKREYYSSVSTTTIKTDGRFIYERIPSSYSSTIYLTRPDIRKMVNGTRVVALGTVSSYSCSMSYIDIDEAVANVSAYVESYVEGFNNRSYAHKESVTIDEKECDVYYDEDIDVEAMYVCDEFIYRIYNYTDPYDYFNITFNYTWGEPEMEDFTLTTSQYYGCDSRFTNVPSRNYAHCSLSSSSSSSWGAYTYIQPSYPCAFEVKVTSSDGVGYYYKFDGNYIYRNQGSGVLVTRPDIRMMENGTEKMAVFTASSSYNCYMYYYPINDTVDALLNEVWHLTDGFNNRTYYHKESITIDRKHYDLYYDEEKEDEVVYVHRGYIYRVELGNSYIKFDYTWFQPKTSEFALSRNSYPGCASYDQRVYSTPSRDYANCVIPVPPSLDSSVRTEAVIFAVIAVIATSLVALF